jgi:hypothetical protein
MRPNHLGDIFQKKNAPNALKFCPNGKISPNLVTLVYKKYPPPSKRDPSSEVFTFRPTKVEKFLSL